MKKEEIANLSLDDAEYRLAEINGKLMLSGCELFEHTHLQDRIDELAGPRDPRHRSMSEHFPEFDALTVYWSYAYDIDLGRIKTPQDALSVISHVAHKGWRYSTSKRVALLIDEIMQIKGWAAFGEMAHPNEAPKPNHDKIGEREKMQPKLRYETIKRDGYRCRACGFGVQDGAHLHVDHIVAIANGGETKKANLQTLCTVCNLGKGAS